MSQVKRRQGYGARLDDLDLLLAVAPGRDVTVQTEKSQADRVDTGQNPEDFVSEVGQTFSRARFAGGEGLDFAHREGSEGDRFWDSENIDVSLPDPGERHSMRLARETSSIYTSSNPQSIVTNGDSLWAILDTDSVERSDDPLADTPSFTDDTPTGASNPTDLAVLGGEVYLSSGSDGVFKRSTDGTWSSWSNQAVGDIWGVKRRVIGRGYTVSENTKLYELGSGDTSVLLITLPEGEKWYDVTDGGSHILAAADSGVYAFSADEGGDMALESQNEIPFESVRTLAVVGQTVFIGTRREVDNKATARLWRAEMAGDGTLQSLDLIREWGDAENVATISHMTPWINAIYIGVFDEADGDWELYLWRYELASGGLSKAFLLADANDNLASKRVTGVTVIGTKLFAQVDLSGFSDPLMRQEDAYETSGHLITPAADFFTSLDKSWQTIRVDAELPTGDDGTDTEVDISYATDLDAMDDPDSSLWTLAGTLTPSSSEGEFNITGEASRFAILKLDLRTSDDQTASPKVNSVSVTGKVVGEEVSVTMPVNVSDRHERFGRRPIRRKAGTGKALLQSLLDKRGASATLELYRHGLTLHGAVESVEAPTQAITPRGSPTQYSLVTFRGTITSKS